MYLIQQLVIMLRELDRAKRGSDDDNLLLRSQLSRMEENYYHLERSLQDGQSREILEVLNTREEYIRHLESENKRLRADASSPSTASSSPQVSMSSVPIPIQRQSRHRSQSRDPLGGPTKRIWRR